MDQDHIYANHVEQALHVFTQIPSAVGELETILIGNPERTRFVLIVMGSQLGSRVHYCATHIEIRDALVWVHDDRIEGLIYDLVAAGIPLEALRLAHRHYEPLTVLDLLRH